MTDEERPTGEELERVDQTPALPASAKKAPLAFEPRNIDEAYRLAKALVVSGFLPTSVATPEAAMAILIAGRDFGLSAMQSFRGLHVIEGSISMSADLMVALVLKSGLAEYFTNIEGDSTIATYETKRKGLDAQQLSFTITEAAAANLTSKNVWKKYPQAMLRARAKSALARDVYPEIFFGVYDPDEIDDMANRTGLQGMDRGPELIPASAAMTTDELQDAVAHFKAKIAAASSPAELNRITMEIADVNESISQEVRDDWKDRRGELKAEKKAADAEIVDADPEEVEGPAGEEPPPPEQEIPVDQAGSEPVQEVFGDVDDDDPWTP